MEEKSILHDTDPYLQYIIEQVRANKKVALDINKLINIVGEKRWQRIVVRALEFVKLPTLNADTEELVELTLAQLQMLFITIADVRYEDLLELADEQQLQAMDKNQLDKLMQQLVPFADVESIFIDPDYKPPCSTTHAGKGKVGYMSRVYRLNYIRLNVHDEQEYFYRLNKKIIEHEPPVGGVIPHPDGYFCVMKSFFGGGACGIPLRTINEPTGDFTNIIMFRGTRARAFAAHDWYKTIYDNLRVNQGAGVMEVFNAIKRHVTDVKHNFIRSKDEKFTICGMSLGGGHAQGLGAALIQLPNLHRVIVAGSIGMDHVSLRLFAAAVNAKDSSKDNPTIIRIIDAADVVTCYGDGHIGRGCQQDKLDNKVWLVFPQSLPVEDNPLQQWLKIMQDNHNSPITSAHGKIAYDEQVELVEFNNIEHYDALQKMNNNHDCEYRASFEKKRRGVVKLTPIHDHYKYARFLLLHAHDVVDSVQTFRAQISRQFLSALRAYYASHCDGNDKIFEDRAMVKAFTVYMEFLFDPDQDLANANQIVDFVKQVRGLDNDILTCLAESFASIDKNNISLLLADELALLDEQGETSIEQVLRVAQAITEQKKNYGKQKQQYIISACQAVRDALQQDDQVDLLRAFYVVKGEDGYSLRAALNYARAGFFQPKGKITSSLQAVYNEQPMLMLIDLPELMLSDSISNNQQLNANMIKSAEVEFTW